MTNNSPKIVIITSITVITIMALCYVIWDRIDQTDEIREAHQQLPEAIERSNKIIEEKNTQKDLHQIDTFDFSNIRALGFEKGSVHMNDSVSLDVMIAGYDILEIEKFKQNSNSVNKP